jgi:hypothetical protein
MNESYFDSDTLIDLKRYDEDYRRAKQGGPLQQQQPQPFQPVPDGKYQVVVETVELTKTRTTGNPMLKWRLRIAGPALADRMLFKNSVITGKTIPFVEKDFRLCGLHMESLSELPSRLPQLVNLRLEVTKKGRTDHPDEIYFDRNLTAVAVHKPDLPEEADELADEDLNDDLPF